MGRDKLALPCGDETLLERVVRLFSACFDKVCLSVGDGAKHAHPDIECIEDVFRGCGPMAGLHAALLKTEAAGIFLLAADLPFANPEAARFIARLGKDRDACMLKTDDGHCEPLFGYYAKSMLPRARAALEAGTCSLTALCRNADLRFVSVAELGNLWREDMLLNVNSPADYEKMKGLHAHDAQRHGEK
jgi:molybdopterin-guanine dinucleotide biosynthesis protein A